MNHISGSTFKTSAWFAAAAAFVLSACSIVTNPATLSPSLTSPTVPTPTPTPTEEPYKMCTPPACWIDEVYFCPGKCPNGCGTTCATRTPNPQDPPTPTIPPFASICSLPTLVPGTPGPSMSVCAAPQSVHVGDTVQITAEITGLQYLDRVEITGENTDQTGRFTATTRPGHLAVTDNVRGKLSLEQVQFQENHLFLVLKAVSPGAIDIQFQAVPIGPDVHTSITIDVFP